MECLNMNINSSTKNLKPAFIINGLKKIISCGNQEINSEIESTILSADVSQKSIPE